MLKGFFVIVIIILTALGLADIIGMLATRFLSCKKLKKNIIVVPITEDDDAEFALRSVIHKYLWGKWDKDSKIICFYDGNNEETEKICKSMCKSYRFVKYKNKEQMEGALKNL